METIYKKALDVANAELFGFKLTEYRDRESFEVIGQYFTLEFEPMVDGIQLHVHEKTDIIVDCMMEELADMTYIREQLEPIMEEMR
ncbi:MAG: hypothetical protein ACPGXZ_17530 [Saprospiraceae bacterium]